MFVHVRQAGAVGPFATENGYDNEGGTDPICWDSRVHWNETVDASDASVSTTIEPSSFQCIEMSNGFLCLSAV